MLKGFAVPVLALAAMANAAAQTTTPDASSEPVDAIFQAWSGPGMPGCSVAVERDGERLLERAYGHANIEHRVRATADTLFEAGSVSKQIVAASVLLLHRDGQLDLDDDVRAYLPELPEYDRPVTLRRMLDHTSGLRDWGAVSAAMGWPRNSRTISNAQVLRIAASQASPNFAAGDGYSYSNTNYNLLAIVIERVSGLSLAEFSGQRIFSPLGMMRSSWRDRHDRIVADRSTGYRLDGDDFVVDHPIEDAYGNGGMITTVDDLLLWNRALDEDRLGPGFTAMMQEQGVLSDGRVIAYTAGGLIRMRHAGLDEFAHTGSTAGYRAWLARYPAQQLSVALLCNTGAAGIMALGRDVANLFLPEATPIEFEPVDPPSGMYANTATGEPVVLAADGGNLVADGLDFVAVDAGRWQRHSTVFSYRRGQLVRETLAGERVPYVPVEPSSGPAGREHSGTYCSADGMGCLGIEERGGEAVMSADLEDPAPLVPAYADAFTWRSFTVRFLRDADGDVSALTIGNDRAFRMQYDRRR